MRTLLCDCCKETNGFIVIGENLFCGTCYTRMYKNYTKAFVKTFGEDMIHGGI